MSLVTTPTQMFPELSLCVNGQESESFSVNAYESEYSKFDESGNINESGKISSSVNVDLMRFTAAWKWVIFLSIMLGSDINIFLFPIHRKLQQLL